ncbi:MAG: DUF2207 domain-containing protein [Amphibacillus sp.]|nr:DUF2207 domain-containing protein [Amphibacillus sp.]
MYKSQIKIISVIIIALFGFILFSQDLEANSMPSLDYSIELQHDGSGIVTEKRQMHLTEGTEVYIVFDQLEGSEITDVFVSDYDEPFTYQENWDINASREAKTGKYSLIPTDEGYEISWGIGEYGDHEYTVRYTISGMVRQLKDGQSMLWRLFQGRNNLPPKKFSITVTGPKYFDPELTKIWGFGYDGEIYLEDGQLVSWSNQPLTGRNHITVYMQFLDQPFQPTLSWDQTLAEQNHQALENNSYQNEDDTTDIVAVILLCSFLGIGVLIVILASIYTAKRNKAIRAANPLITGIKRTEMNEGKVYREIPYSEGNILDVAYLLQEHGKGDMEAYFNAFLLKWLKEGYIVQLNTNEANGDKLKLTVQLLDSNTPELEQQFFDILLSAADRYGVVDTSDVTRWAEKNYDKITELKASLPYESKRTLIDRGYLYNEDVYFLGNFRAEVTKSSYQGEDLYNRLIQFENYLNELLSLDRVNLQQQNINEDIIIWASLYNLVEPFVEKFQEVEPAYFVTHHFNYSNIYLLSLYSSGFSSGYDQAVTSHQTSMGSGGTTSFGGGGGSFGGGGGGVR